MRSLKDQIDIFVQIEEHLKNARSKVIVKQINDLVAKIKEILLEIREGFISKVNEVIAEAARLDF